MKLPREVDDLTAPWFSAVLGREVTQATVVDRHTGTTGRARVLLEGEDGVPAGVLVKLPPFDEQQRRLVDKTGMGVTEARFYRDLAAEVPVRVPRVWYADTDGSDYVMVLEDLAASGCRFPSPRDDDVEHRARDIVSELTELHAAYWDSDRFSDGHDLDWLVVRAMRRVGGGNRYVQHAVEVLGDRFGDDFHRIADCYLAHTADIVELWWEGTPTLIHGDPHMGNLFVDVDAGGRTGFLDWAVVSTGQGIRDVAYVMCNSVPVAVREAIEREVVEGYCATLTERGVPDVDVDDVWDRYRIQALYSWVSAVATAGMGSKWQAIEIGLSATERTTAACTHLGTVDAIEARLGR